MEENHGRIAMPYSQSSSVLGLTFRGPGLSYRTANAVPLRGFRSDAELTVSLKAARTIGADNQVLELFIDDPPTEHTAYEPDALVVRGGAGCVISACPHTVRIAGLARETVIGATGMTPVRSNSECQVLQ